MRLLLFRFPDFSTIVPLFAILIVSISQISEHEILSDCRYMLISLVRPDHAERHMNMNLEESSLVDLVVYFFLFQYY